MIAAAVATPLAAQPAIAESVAVTYQDLDLSTSQGQETLKHRIDEAAKEVCGFDEITTGTRIHSREARECIKTAKRQIQKKLAAIFDKDRGGG
jgi:UrcA family protein